MFTELTHTVIQFLMRISDVIPLPWFTFLGSFIEEIIAPIPSPLIMTLAGTLAVSEKYGWIQLIFIATTAAIGKTIASYIMYALADKGEDIVLTKFGKFLGVSHKKVESIGAHLNKGWQDDIVLILLRAVPIIPTAPISIICGLIKVNLRTYITSTFIGTCIRNILYLAIGYNGANAVEAIIVRIEDFEIVGYGVIILLVASIVGYMYYQRHKEAIFHRLFPGKKPADSNSDPDSK